MREGLRQKTGELLPLPLLMINPEFLVLVPGGGEQENSLTVCFTAQREGSFGGGFAPSEKFPENEGEDFPLKEKEEEPVFGWDNRWELLVEFFKGCGSELRLANKEIFSGEFSEEITSVKVIVPEEEDPIKVSYTLTTKNGSLTKTQDIFLAENPPVIDDFSEMEELEEGSSVSEEFLSSGEDDPLSSL